MKFKWFSVLFLLFFASSVFALSESKQVQVDVNLLGNGTFRIAIDGNWHDFNALNSGASNWMQSKDFNFSENCQTDYNSLKQTLMDFNGFCSEKISGLQFGLTGISDLNQALILTIASGLQSIKDTIDLNYMPKMELVDGYKTEISNLKSQLNGSNYDLNLAKIRAETAEARSRDIENERGLYNLMLIVAFFALVATLFFVLGKTYLNKPVNPPTLPTQSNQQILPETKSGVEKK